MLMKKSEDIEHKAERLLSNLRNRLNGGILFKIRNAVEYKLENKEDADEEVKRIEDLNDVLRSIADPERWEHHGIMDKADVAMMDTLEYLLDDERKEIRKTKGW